MAELAPDLIRRVLVATAFDYAGEVYWFVGKDGDLGFSLDCSDFFDLACADTEPVETEQDVELLERCLADLRKVEHTSFPIHLTELYAVRRRQKLPLYLVRNSSKHQVPEEVVALFMESVHTGV